MIPLKEIIEYPELQEIKKSYGGSEWMEDYLRAHAGKQQGGFVDPFFLSPDPQRREAVYETMRKIPLREMLGGGTGSDYMSYLIPTKVYQVLLDANREEDILPQIAGLVINDFQGGSVQVDWGLRDKLKPHWGSSLGAAAIETDKFNKATLTPKEFSMDMAISRGMLEDSAFDLIQYHVAAGGKEMANFAVAEGLKALYAGRDTGNNEAGGSNVVAVLDFVNAAGLITGQGGRANTAVICEDQKWDLIGDVTTFNLAGLAWKEAASRGDLMNGFLGMNWYTRLVSTGNGLCDPADLGDYYALVFEKERSLAVAWKRPITIDNYTSPREGLAGASVSARVDFDVMHDGDYVSAILET